MKFPLSPGEYMVVTGALYLVAGLVNLFVYRFTQAEYIQMVWIFSLLIPVLFPVTKLVRGTPFWRIK